MIQKHHASQKNINSMHASTHLLDSLTNSRWVACLHIGSK